MRATIVATILTGLAVVQLPFHASIAEERLPWETRRSHNGAQDPYNPGRPPPAASRYDTPRKSDPSSSSYGPPQRRYSPKERVDRPPRYDSGGKRSYRGGDRYAGTSRHDDRGRGYNYERPEFDQRATYAESEIINAGHKFFGTISAGLAKAIEHVFAHQGRPTGYILGEDAGGAFVAGLRYGEGRLHTKYGGSRKLFWQGPSIGYDFGGEGGRTMVLIYNLRDPEEIYRRFGGVQGSAYLVGGASVQLLANEGITLAPIRAGVGLRLGANIGYLKYTRRPTLNPF